MLQSLSELRESLKNSKVITKEVSDTLLELDVLPSRGTQVDLNNMLVELYNRIKVLGSIPMEAIEGLDVTPVVFKEWVNQKFTVYSYNMFIQTIGDK
ncbi:MAG: hypothetical protein J6A59_09065 [Lachnospiraceae bacterium]|nr:hypothetical protein [Lachnospiraceae bacterium]